MMRATCNKGILNGQSLPLVAKASWVHARAGLSISWVAQGFHADLP